MHMEVTKAELLSLRDGKDYKFIRFQGGHWRFWRGGMCSMSHSDMVCKEETPISAGLINVGRIINMVDPYSLTLQLRTSEEDWTALERFLREKVHSINMFSPEVVFDDTSEWVKSHPGSISWTCEFCGLYEASIPQCNKCEECD